MQLRFYISLLRFGLVLCSFTSGWCRGEVTIESLGKNLTYTVSNEYGLIAYLKPGNDPRVVMRRTSDMSLMGELAMEAGLSVIKLVIGSKGQGVFGITEQGKILNWIDLTKPARVTDLENGSGLKPSAELILNGSRLIGVTKDRVDIWDVATGKRVTESSICPPDSVVGFVSDYASKTVSIVCADQVIKFDTSIPEIAEAMAGFKGSIRTMQISPTKRFATGIGSTSIQLIDLERMETDFIDCGSTDHETFSVGFMEDESCLIVGKSKSKGHEVDVWHLNGSIPSMVYGQPIVGRLQGRVICLPKSKTVAFTSGVDLNYVDATIRVTNITGTSNVEFGYGPHESYREDQVTPIAVSKSEELLLSATPSNRLFVWSLATPQVDHFKEVWGDKQTVTSRKITGSLVQTIDLPSMATAGVIFGDDRYLLVTCKNETTYLIDIGSKKPSSRALTVAFLNANTEKKDRLLIKSVDFSEDGKHLVVNNFQSLSIIDTHNGNEIWQKKEHYIASFFDVSSEKVLLLRTNGQDFFNLKTRSLIPLGRFKQSEGNWASHRLVSGVKIDGIYSVIDTTTASIVSSIKPDEVQFDVYDVMPDNSRMVIGGKMKNSKHGIEVFDLKGMQRISAIPIANDQLIGVQFVEGGQYVAAIGGTKVRIYDYRKNRLVREIPESAKVFRDDDRNSRSLVDQPSSVITQGVFGSTQTSYSDQISHAAYHDQSNTLAVANAGIVRLFDATSGAKKYSTAVESKLIYGISFSGDGKRLATFNDQGRIWILDLPEGN